jgi:hypothetical protein
MKRCQRPRAKAKHKRSASPKKPAIRQLRFPAPPELIEKLQALERQGQAYWDAMPKITAQDRALLRKPPARVEVISVPASDNKPVLLSDAKPGSAAAWMNELWPNEQWRLLTSKQIFNEIVKAAKLRKLTKWPSETAVRDEVNRRTRKTRKTRK